MKTTAIQDIMRDLDLVEESAADGKPKRNVTLTIWLPEEDKARYDRIQKMSGRRFSKKIREVVQAVLDMAEEKTG